MTSFVRKNIVVCTVVFTALDGSITQPSAANLVLSYQNQQCSPQSATIALTFNPTTGVWVGEWDSSAAGKGTVFWMAYGFGSLQAAEEGSFDIEANAANTV